MTRFLLRETVSQLQALQSSLEGASDTLEAQAQTRGPRYVRSPADLRVQFLKTHHLHRSNPSAFTALSSFSRLLALGQGGQKGERGWLALNEGLHISRCLSCPLPPTSLVLFGALRVCRQCTEPPLPVGQLKREWKCRAGPVAAGGQGAGPCGASAGHPPGLLAPLMQVCGGGVGGLLRRSRAVPPMPAPPLPLSSS